MAQVQFIYLPVGEKPIKIGDHRNIGLVHDFFHVNLCFLVKHIRLIVLRNTNAKFWVELWWNQVPIIIRH